MGPQDLPPDALRRTCTGRTRNYPLQGRCAAGRRLRPTPNLVRTDEGTPRRPSASAPAAPPPTRLTRSSSRPGPAARLSPLRVRGRRRPAWSFPCRCVGGTGRLARFLYLEPQERPKTPIFIIQETEVAWYCHIWALKVPQPLTEDEGRGRGSMGRKGPGLLPRGRKTFGILGAQSREDSQGYGPFGHHCSVLSPPGGAMLTPMGAAQPG